MLCMYPYVRAAGRYQSIKGARFSAEMRRDLTPFPCGQCLYCRINKRREYTCRICMEAENHDKNLFVTLTYNDDHLPEANSLKKEEFKKFIRKFRKKLKPLKFRYFGVGEYGDEGEREVNPHYHIALFGLDYDVENVIKKAWTDEGESMGNVYLGDLNKDSAQYIAQYTLKKMTKHNDWLDEKYKWFKGLEPEFMSCSKQNGGIGYHKIVEIAQQIRRNKCIEIENVIRKVNIAGKGLPIGSYLTAKLAELIGMDAAILNRELWMWQESVFDEYLDKDDGLGEYYSKLVKGGEARRKKIDFRLEIKENHRML